MERLINDEESLLNEEPSSNNSLIQTILSLCNYTLSIVNYNSNTSEEFISKFNSKFPNLSRPAFSKESIRDVITQSSNIRKPLLLYVYNSKESDLIKYFLQRTICNCEAIPFIVVIEFKY